MDDCKSSPSNPVPLLTMMPAEEEEQQQLSSHSKSQLQWVASSHFGDELPDDWLVEEQRRPLSNTRNPGKIDTFYIEPGTGMKFHSLAAVQVYLTEGEIDSYTTKVKPDGECIKQYKPHSSNTSSSILPNDWLIEERPRKNPAHIDKYYIEPGTGFKFRSRAAVQRYLTEGKIDIRTRRENPVGEYIVSCRMKQFRPRSSSSFILPDDWIIEERPRPTNPGHIDKYYIEPGTGLKFRSRAAVQRYLTEGKIDVRTKKVKPSGEYIEQFRPRSSSTFILPDDWVIEERPRPTNPGHIDKYYIEPGSGHHFRSLASVERYLTGENEDIPLKALMPATMSSISPGFDSQKMKSFSEFQSQQIVPSPQKRNICGENDIPPKPPASVSEVQSQRHVPNSLKRNSCGDVDRPPKPPASASEVQSQQLVPSSLKRNICGANGRPPRPPAPKPPEKVHWVLDGPAGEDKWFPFINNSKVPESVMGKWAETFISTMYRRKIGAPSFKS